MTDLPSKPIGVLSMFAHTSTSIDVFSDSIIADVKNGEVDPLNVLIWLRAFEKASKRILEEIKSNLETAAEKYPGIKFQFMGNDVEKADFGKYDYLTSKDPVYERRLAIANAADTLVKERQEWLKTVKAPMKILDEDTGELVEILPPLKKSNIGLKVTIK